MEENTGRSWYLAVDTVIFCLSIIILLAAAGVSGRHLSSTIHASSYLNSTIIENSGAGGTEVFCGLSKDPYRTDKYGEYVTREGVMSELLAMPLSVNKIQINGTYYINSDEMEEEGSINAGKIKENIRGEKNLHYYVQENNLYEIYVWIGSGDIFQKEYGVDFNGRINSITYTVN